MEMGVFIGGQTVVSGYPVKIDKNLKHIHLSISCTKKSRTESSECVKDVLSKSNMVTKHKKTKNKKTLHKVPYL